MTLAERTRLLRRSLVAAARELTVEHGLAGFTLEQLGEQVGVSRRTLFNHFASKEDVVLGIEIGTDDELLDEFAAGLLVPTGTPPLAAVLELAAIAVRRFGVSREENTLMKAVLEREPALVARFMTATDEQLVRVATALTRREHWDDTDPRGRLTAQLAAAVLRTAADDFFAQTDSAPFDVIIADHLRLATTVISAADAAPTPDLQEHQR